MFKHTFEWAIRDYYEAQGREDVPDNFIYIDEDDWNDLDLVDEIMGSNEQNNDMGADTVKCRRVY